MVRRANGRAAAAAVDGTIAPGSRVAIVGRSGSGKSVLLRALVTSAHRALFLDPKRNTDFGGWATLEGTHELEREWPRHVERAIARPGLAETAGGKEPAWMDAGCRLAYRAGSCTVAVDELAGIATASRPVPGLEVLLRRGRDPGPQGPITTIVATQRPRAIPLTVLSEADHVFLFDLNQPADRAFVAELVGAYERPRIPHGFWYWRPELERAVECEPIGT